MPFLVSYAETEFGGEFPTEADYTDPFVVELIQKKGLAKVAKKAGAIAADGLIHSYIHAGGRIGVLLEVNCQTDFVARNEEFKAFVDELAMHIASEAPTVVREEELSSDQLEKQKRIFEVQLAEEAKETGKEKPAAAVEKIMVRSHRLQWMGWRWLYHVAWPVAWLAGGPAASLGASRALTLFFAREDRAPVAS